ncbi:response regulator [Candidatus Uabimicrobium amorphum]|uniref:response regulator n=1 Tax=Uabimicrobium amorphum TaxID=2596890 RepID=UPI00125F4755
MKALVVDDSRTMRLLVMKNLRDADITTFDFVEAEDGEQAMLKLKKQQPDIFFVDWNMPKMSGIDLVRKLRSLERFKDTPIIMVTSEKGMDKVIEAIDKAGADDYISKPFTPQIFRSKVSRLVELG